MTAPDATGYTEKMVIKQVTQSTLTLWKGTFPDGGSTMSGNFICVGN
jgi:hypothetical protein